MPVPKRADPFGWVSHVLADKYRVDSLVGEGGFGVVYHAHHLGFDQPIALKCLKLKSTMSESSKAEFLKRFIAEGKLLHQLSRASADIVQCLDVGVATSPSGIETPYLVLEWLDGKTLDRELRESRGERRSIEEAMAWLEPAARGLAVAHDQGVSHRDIKPANIMLTGMGDHPTVKLLDFGIAKGPSDEPAITMSKPFDGFGGEMQAFTPRYGAPEQFSQKYGTTGPWTDVYAFALLLVELVTGESALSGDDPVQIYIETSDSQRRPSLRARGAEVSDEVERVVLRALAVDPKMRFATLGEFWDELHAAAGTQTTRIKSVRPPPFSKSSGSLPSVPPPSTDMASVSIAPRHPRMAYAWFGALALVILVGVGVAIVKSSTPHVATLPASIPDAATTGPRSPNGMISVPAATFTMGSDDDSKGDRPAHTVTLMHAFYIDRTEVTTEAYGACMKAGACTANAIKDNVPTAFSGCNSVSDPNFARQPINCTTYDQAAAYCQFVGKRLPTEAEWELAARGTDGRIYPWGNAPPTSCRQAVVGGIEGPCGLRKGTYEVGTTIDGASPYGALDMAGNVWEWVSDAFEPYPKDRAVDPFLPPRPGSRGVLRGGSWDYSAQAAKTSTRLPIARTWSQASIGFRCAK